MKQFGLVRHFRHYKRGIETRWQFSQFYKIIDDNLIEMLKLNKSVQYRIAKVHLPIFIVLCVFVDKTLCQFDNGYYRDQSGQGEGSTAGDRTAAWTQYDGVNVEELGDEFQGDMIINKLSDLESPKPWPGKRIPYVITGQFTPSELNAIERAMGDIHNSTCLRFVPRTEEKYYLSISSIARGCVSHVGFNSTDYPMMNLQTPHCLVKKGTIIHELMHVAGINHEQSRYDRDNYVRVLWDNIMPSKIRNFATYQNDGDLRPYSYTSVMHYSSYAFSKNKQRTLVPNWQNFEEAQTGQRDHMMSTDSDKINALYQCPAEYFSDQYPPKLLGNPPPNPYIPVRGYRISGIIDADTGRFIKKIMVPELSINVRSGWQTALVGTPIARTQTTGSGTGNTLGTQHSDNRVSHTTNTYNPGFSTAGYNPSNDVQYRYANSGIPSNGYHSLNTVQPVAANSGISNIGYYPTNTIQSGYAHSGIPITGYYPLNTGQSGYSHSGSTPKRNDGSGYYVQSQ